VSVVTETVEKKTLSQMNVAKETEAVVVVVGGG
jgi:hypothetical protein